MGGVFSVMILTIFLVNILQKGYQASIKKNGKTQTFSQELPFLKNMSRNLPMPAFGWANTFRLTVFLGILVITFDGTF